jgi:hypothetical protein
MHYRDRIDWSGSWWDEAGITEKWTDPKLTCSYKLSAAGPDSRRIAPVLLGLSAEMREPRRIASRRWESGGEVLIRGTLVETLLLIGLVVLSLVPLWYTLYDHYDLYRAGAGCCMDT